MIKRLVFIITMLLFTTLQGQSLTAAFAVGGDTNLTTVRVCAGYPVKFHDVSQGNYNLRLWTMNGGTPPLPTSPNPTVVFNNNGTYNCSLSISNNLGVSNTINFVVVVSSNKPTATFGLMADVCSSDPPYSPKSVSPLGGKFFGNGVVNNLFDPNVADTGYHTLGYIYTSANGCSDTAYSTVYVKPGPTAELIELNNFSNCNGFSTPNPDFLITIFDQSTSPDSIIKYEIIWGDGTPDWDSIGFRSTGFKHTYFGQGIYNLQYIVTGAGGCTDTAKYKVINTSNPASLNIVNPGGTNGCAPVSVTFPLSTTNTDTTITYTIEWGDGKDTTFNHPPPSNITHIYDTTSCLFPGGFFNIKAIAKNACITTQSTVAGPFVTQPAVADFTPSPGCVNKPNTLPNLSIPGFSNACSRLSTYIWDFGDGSPAVTVVSSQPMPPAGVHTWTVPGVYDVELIVVSLGANCPGDTITYPVCIEDVKNTAVSFRDTIGCAPFILDVTNTSDTVSQCTPIVSYWDVNNLNGVTFNNGTTLNSYEPQFVFNTKGTYTVTYTHGNGCNVDTVSRKIYVKGPPTVTFPPAPTSFCDTLTIDFATDSLHHPQVNSNLSAIQSYDWSITPNTFTFLNGTNANSQYPVVKLDPNTYTIIHTVTNLCGSTSDTQTFTVNQITNGGFIIDTTQGCSPLIVNVQSTSSVGVGHEWFLNGVSYSTQRDTSFELHNLSTQKDSIISIKLAVYSGIGCTDTIRSSVTVFASPQISFGFNEVCQGDTAAFFDSTRIATAPINLYQWDFGDGQTSNIQNPKHFYSNPGKYLVSLLANDTNGCSGFFEDTVWIKSPPQANFNLNYSSFPDSACILDTLFFIDSTVVDALGTPISSYEWDVFNDGFLDGITQNHKHVFTSPGTYDVKLKVISQSGCIDSIIKQVYISNPPLPSFSLSQYSGCTPITVTAADSSSGYILNYYWDFYTLDSNGVQNHLHTANTKDPNPIPALVATGYTNSTVFATLTTSNSCYSATAFDTISVVPIPIPYFQMNVDTGCSPLTITIQTDGVVSGQPDSIMFNFGDGSPELKLLPLINILPNGDTLYTWNQQQHTFTYNGNKLDTTYFITLRGINECGDSTFTSAITVKNRSVQSFFNSNTNYGCTPLNVSFNNYAFAATQVSYCFDFDTITKSCVGALSSNWNPSFNFSQPGQYVVAQFASNSCGKDTSYQIIDVLPKPNAQITFSNLACQGDTVDFMNNTTLSSGSIIGYTWYFGDGDSSSVLNPYHIYDTAGVFNVCLLVETDAGCDTTTCQTIQIFGKPSPDYSFVNNKCLNQQPVNFLNLSSNSTGNIISYEWDFGDGNTSTLLNPPHSYAQAGTYNVKLKIINDDYCKDSISQLVTVLPVPESDFTFAFQSGDSCGVPQTVAFTNGSNGGAGYYWDFDYINNPGVNTSNVIHPSFLYSNPGVYTVMLISSNGFACSDTTFKEVVVHPIPEVDLAVDLTQGCMPLEVNFTNLTQLPPGFTDNLYYIWDFGDGSTSTAKDPVHTYTTNGKYTVRLTVTSEYACEDFIVYPDLIEVFPVPVPSFTSNLVEFGIYDFFQQTYGGASPYLYSWDFGDGQTSVITNPQHAFDVNRINYNNGYWVCLTVTDANGCDSTTCDTLRIGAFTLFVPNAMSPGTAGEASVFLPKGQGLKTYECQIFDRWGNLLWKTNEIEPETASPKEAWDGTYNGKPVPMGVYVWRIDARFENGAVWRRFDENGNLMGNTGTITIVR